MMVEQPQDRRTRSYRAVVLDYGMVLCHRPTVQEIDRIAGLFGITHAAFWTSYERNRLLYDRGDLTPAEYWFRFAEGASCPIEENTIERLQKWDIEMWSSMDARMLCPGSPPGFHRGARSADRIRKVSPTSTEDSGFEPDVKRRP